MHGGVLIKSCECFSEPISGSEFLQLLYVNSFAVHSYMHHSNIFIDKSDHARNCNWCIQKLRCTKQLKILVIQFHSNKHIMLYYNV